MRIQELEVSLNNSYTQGYIGGIPKFIDDFSELEGLYYEHKKWGLEVPIYVNVQKKNKLLGTLAGVGSVQSMVQQLRREPYTEC